MRNLTSALNRVENASNAFEAIDAIQLYLLGYFKLENIHLQKLQGKSEILQEQREKFLLHGEKIIHRISVLVPLGVQKSTIFRKFIDNLRLESWVRSID